MELFGGGGVNQNRMFYDLESFKSALFALHALVFLMMWMRLPGLEWFSLHSYAFSRMLLFFLPLNVFRPFEFEAPVLSTHCLFLNLLVSQLLDTHNKFHCTCF